MLYSSTIQLRFTPRHSFVSLRELTGDDELCINDTGSGSSIRLINRLLSPDAVLQAQEIVTADRDHILAVLYISVFGPGVEGAFTCKECKERFTVRFVLNDFEKHLRKHALNAHGDNGIYKVGELEFRLPTGEDELAISNLPYENAIKELATRCLIKGDEGYFEKLQQTMSGIAPMLHTDIKAVCPTCGSQQKSEFDIQSYFLEKIIREQKVIQKDVHRIASAYKWSYHEIMELPRKIRRNYVSMIEAESLKQ